MLTPVVLRPHVMLSPSSRVVAGGVAVDQSLVVVNESSYVAPPASSSAWRNSPLLMIRPESSSLLRMLTGMSREWLPSLRSLIKILPSSPGVSAAFRSPSR